MTLMLLWSLTKMYLIRAQATRNLMANALKRKTKQFNAIEVKTSCVRIKYADGYHIDLLFANWHYDFTVGAGFMNTQVRIGLKENSGG